jgi:hypothetical protein
MLLFLAGLCTLNVIVEFAKVFKLLVFNACVLRINSLISEVEAGKHDLKAASEPL